MPRNTPLVHLPPCEHYVNTASQLTKAIGLTQNEMFDITVDFEDALGIPAYTPVTDSMQQEIFAVIKNSSANQRIGIRVAESNTPQANIQLEQIIKHVGNQLSYLTIPKIRQISQIQQILYTLNNYLQKYQIKHSIPLQILIENQEALEHCNEIAAIPGVEALCFGIIDFVEDHAGLLSPEVMASPQQFEHALIHAAKTKIVSAAMRHYKTATHNACLYIDSINILANDVMIAQNKYGFSRMLSIHPAQIKPILSGFKLHDTQLNEYLEILTQAKQINWKPIKYNGMFYDLASYRCIYNQLKRLLPNKLTKFLELDQLYN